MSDKWEQTAQAAWSAIFQKVNALKAEGKTLQAIADIVGVSNRSVVGEWLNGNRSAANTSFANLMNYLERLGYNYIDFFPKETLPTIRRLAPNAPVESVAGEDLQELAVYDAAGAGPAVGLSDMAPLFTIFAPPDYLRQASFALVVDGHSMEPLIPHRATVGVNTDVPFAANEVYAANIPYEGLVIKRVAVDMAAREFVFKSENPNKDAYPDFRLNIAEAEKIIVGRVVWVMWGY